MRADPPVRRDGRCAECREPRNPRANRYSGLAAQLDPFCSTGCCKAWHGLAEPERRRGTRRAYA